MRRLLAVVLVVFLQMAACTAEKDPIIGTVELLVEAAEDRDAEEVVAFLSSGYPGREEVERELRRYFFGYDNLDITVRELQSESNPDGGWATFRVDFTGTPKKAAGLDQFLPRSATYRFALDFIMESGRMKIAKAQWEREK